MEKFLQIQVVLTRVGGMTTNQICVSPGLFTACYPDYFDLIYCE